MQSNICSPDKILIESEAQQRDTIAVGKKNRKQSFKSNEHQSFYFHLGVLIFASYFQRLKERDLGYIKQWLMSILLGAQNIEQTKELNYSSLSAMLGHVIKHPSNQRIALKQIASTHNTDNILRFNGEMVNVASRSDFYYDPHTKHYTGQLKILDTWCPSVRLADKGINSDYIHTTDGYPLYFDTTDNFYDLRERFMKNIKRFRSLMGIPEDKIITTIVDRGIFSTEIFNDIAQSLTEHIITWEKGYNRDKWDENAQYGSGCIIKKRNHRHDNRLVHYRYQDGIWDKETGMRQIIVRVLNKKWETLIEVSILTDDKEREATKVIELMLKRWIQENDFKYLIKHFGINEITTYAFIDYKDLREKIEDKLYTGGKYKEFTKEIQRIRAKFKTALLSKHKFEQKHQGAEKKLTNREKERKRKIWQQVEQLELILKQLEQDRKEYVNKTSKIEELIQQDYKKLDTNAKNFMDAIKILARNMFYLSLLPFKEKYNNYRDDHVLFRNLTRSAGTINHEKGVIHVNLRPTMEFTPNIKNIFTEILNKINLTQPNWPCSPDNKIVLEIAN